MGSFLNFAVVGCGRISQKHFDAIAECSQAKLSAVCDIDEAVARATGERLGVKWHTDIEKMLSDQNDIDVVDILTPSGLHAEHAIKAAECGKHVVVEKPMALTLESADEMIRACDKHGVKLFVVKQNRYNKPIARLREFYERGHFGKLTLGTVRVRWCRTQAYYDLADWRGTWAMDGGVFANQASHHIDMLQWFFGEVETVFTKTGTFLSNIEVEDTGVAVLKFSSGALGIIEATTATRPKDLEGSLSILGEKGSVVIGGFALNKVDSWSFEGREDNDQIKDELSVYPPNIYGYGHKAYIENVCKSLSGKSRALVDGWEGYKTLKLINALYESAETGSEVVLNFKPKKCQLGLRH